MALRRPRDLLTPSRRGGNLTPVRATGEERESDPWQSASDETSRSPLTGGLRSRPS